ncbi:MAG: ferritin [Myxococcales bacterium]|nr:MAG: ferritin [Myxococcales bacterium]
MSINNEVERLLTVAIGREAEAYRFYNDVAKRVKDAGVRQVFAELAEEERKHEELLWRVKGDATLPFKIAMPKDLKLAESVELPELKADMKPADAIALAMKKELLAAEFYRDLAAASTDLEFKGLCENLSNMELNHKQRLENIYVHVGYPEAW